MALELWLLSVVSTVTTIVIFTFILLIFIYLSTDPYPNMQREPTEKCFLDPDTSEYIKFSTSLSDRSQLELSVIVPAFNEMDRLPSMLNEALSYLDKRKEHDSKFSFEIIIVDDGSTDHTTEVALKYSKTHGSDKIRLLKLLRNRGKGAAVRFGMLSARGRLLLFADADGATKFSDVERLEDALSSVIASRWNGAMSVICGSRAHMEAEAIVKRHFLRNLLMYGFKLCVWLLCVRGVRDTQCGFKLFSRTAARVLFHNLHVERWAFDVDLLYLARHFDMEVVEVPVHWHEVGGSKLVPIFSWLQMAKDLLLIRLRYSLGAWKIERVHI
ncbi:Dolichyl-phosphate beta-D-mannosyltransferase [Paragonimus heterotremus]|uniref:Dolichyl-phosphate beta-glucosyltransferase n=1 Tax=Paragonimus heterotremus TaxID=100268 RepID=A0A8J4T2S3_9TREM|nr:Dolichyl-phosphate beta-D-mannosyltransferase [Paragonimus heterotremus]